MQKWEYFVAPLLPHNPGEILNNFGQDGWELVNVVSQDTPAGGTSLVAYHKRAKGLAHPPVVRKRSDRRRRWIALANDRNRPDSGCLPVPDFGTGSTTWSRPEPDR